MRINLKSFRKVREDGEKATLRNERGHEITLAKNALAPHLIDQLKTLPLHLNQKGAAPEEGEVQSPDPTDTSQPTTGSPTQGPQPDPNPNPAAAPISDPREAELNAKMHHAIDNFHAAKSFLSTVLFGSPAERAYLNPQAQQTTTQAPQSAPAPQSSQALAPGPQEQAPQSNSMSMDDVPDAYSQFMTGQEQYLSGIGDQAKAEGNLGEQTASAENQFGESQKQAFIDYQNNLQDIHNERDGIIKDINNNIINPNHYVENMSVPAKVSSAIGILLSGIGSGLTGKDNLAMKYLNDQIDRDINAQKANLGQKNTLLSANFQKEGDLDKAMQMTKINLQDIMAHKIQEEAAKSSYPMAKAKADQLSGMYLQQSAGQAQQLAFQRMAMKQLNGGGQDPESKLARLSTAGVMNPKESEETEKELQAVRNHARQSDAVLGSFDRANQENTVAGRMMHAGFEPASVKTYRTVIMPYLKDAEGRINESELQRTDALIPSPGDSPSKIQEKRQGLTQFLQEKAPTTSHLRRWGINPSQYGRFNDSGQNKFQEGAPVKPK